MQDTYIGTADSALFNEVVQKLRSFFLSKNFIEVHTQDRLSILAACEDPDTITTFTYQNMLWPLPQTGQMWLEYELLKNPEYAGVFCVSTSYRAEPNPIPGRHNVIFPMFEFESKGTIDELREMETELLEYLGFAPKHAQVHKTYGELKDYYQTDELTAAHELSMQTDFSPCLFLEKFPEETSPFWNMKRTGALAHKIDVILYGMETIGSAERETDKDVMRERFLTISGGEYAGKLYTLFGKERVQKELDEFLVNRFFPRYGGGIGMTRLMRAYKMLKEE